MQLNKSQSILVTGGAGYIGAHCCKKLSEAGYQPVCYDNLSTGHASFAKWGPLVVGDIRDTDTLTNALTSFNVGAVVHFAAYSLVGESVLDPQKYYQNNVAGTLSLLQAMRNAGCLNLVFSSTGAVYGAADSKAIAEVFPCAPINPYGFSKWMVETLLSDYRRAYGLAFFSLRYFNASGADLLGQIGEHRKVETHLIPRALMAIEGSVASLDIFGDNYDTPDGTAIRDYIHVADLATAHVRAIEMLFDGHVGDTINLGTGIGLSVHQILSAIATVTGKSVPQVVKGRRAGDPTFLVADPSRATAILNFKPKHSDINTIVKTAWAWHQKRFSTSD